MELRGQRVLVMGLGRSGLGAVRLCASLGADVVATDRRSEDKLGDAAMDELRAAGAELVLGEHRDRDFVGADLIVISPGIPLEQPHVARALEAGVRVVGELELAVSQLECPVVGITGTNGKSTTTTFTGDLLEAAGLSPFVGGNLGLPVSEGVMQGRPGVAVVEVSSFQLETAPTFHPTVAAMLNCTEDHLDRYPSFDEYRSAKERIFANLTGADTVIYNAADSIVVDMIAGVPARMQAFSLIDHGVAGAFLDGDTMILRDPDGRLDLAGFVVPGSHNIENLMAAVLCARAAGADPAFMESALARLRGLPHRMEWVRRLDGVDWYNDSKATNVASAAKTLEGIGRPAVVLLGGKDKGGDYTPLVEALEAGARGAVVYGAAAPVIRDALEGTGVRFDVVEDLAQAVALARLWTHDGDAVLLSPACSSYDQFRDYEQRGDTFRELVEALT